MREPDRRQRIQRNRAIAVQGVMLLAGAGLGAFFVMKAISGEPQNRDFNIFAAVGCFGVAAFYVWLFLRRRRREKLARKILAEKQKKKRGSGPG